MPSPLADYPVGGDSQHPAAAQLRDPARYAAMESDLVLLGLAGLVVSGAGRKRSAVSAGAERARGGTGPGTGAQRWVLAAPHGLLVELVLSLSGVCCR